LRWNRAQRVHGVLAQRREEQGTSLDDYVEMGVLKALEVARVSGAEKVNALGFCVGGTLLGWPWPSRRQRRKGLESATYLASMLDFRHRNQSLRRRAECGASEAAIGRRASCRAATSRSCSRRCAQRPRLVVLVNNY